MIEASAPQKTWHPPPLFLSDEATMRVDDVFHRYKSERSLAASEVEAAKHYVMHGDWKEYDQLYVALYTVHLGGVKMIAPINVGYDDRIKKRVGVYFSDDIVRIAHPKKLLDELGVASMVRFKSMFERCTPFTTSLSSVGFGCFFMCFDFVMPKRETLANLYPEMSLKEAAQEIFDFHLGVEKVAKIKRDFEVAYIARD